MLEYYNTEIYLSLFSAPPEYSSSTKKLAWVEEFLGSCSDTCTTVSYANSGIAIAARTRIAVIAASGKRRRSKIFRAD